VSRTLRALTTIISVVVLAFVLWGVSSRVRHPTPLASGVSSAKARDGAISIAVGDSAEFRYDSSSTSALDVECVNCAPNATTLRLASNEIRVYANKASSDAVDRDVCFTVRDASERRSRVCTPIEIASAPPHVYSVPQAIRESEVVALHLIPVETYDKTGQSSHPDFLRIAVPWSTHTCWLVFTPYAGEQIERENPSLASGTDCEHFVPAEGVKAPLVDKPANGYNSDPELLYDAARGCLGVMFRTVTTANNVLLTKSCDGTAWSEPRVLFTVPNHGAISPTTAAGPDGAMRVWYVAAGQQGCGALNNVVKLRIGSSASTPLERLSFGDEIPTDLAQPDWVIWHIKVRYIPEKKQYWAMYAAFPKAQVGGCLNNDLFFATSTDGVHWKTFPVPMLDHLDSRYRFVSLYRASFDYDAATDRIRTIVSAKDTVWGEYGVSHNYTALKHALDTARTLPVASLVGGANVVRVAPAQVQRIRLNTRP
jgi:hypothetical protein